MESVDERGESRFTERGHPVCAAVEGVNQARTGGDQTGSDGSHDGFDARDQRPNQGAFKRQRTTRGLKPPWEHIRRQAHVQRHVGVQEALQVGLPDVNGGEVVIPSRGKQKDEADRRRLDDDREHPVEVDTMSWMRTNQSRLLSRLDKPLTTSSAARRSARRSMASAARRPSARRSKASAARRSARRLMASTARRPLAWRSTACCSARRLMASAA